MPAMTAAAKPPQSPSTALCTRQGSLLTLAILTLISFTYFSLKSLNSPIQYNSYNTSPQLIIKDDSNTSPQLIFKDDSEELSDAYHSPEIFRLNYAEMEKKFKVYIYTDGDPKTFYQTPRKLTGKYASEGYFFQNIRESKFRTDDPDQADLFFIPISCHKMRGKGTSYENMTIIVQNYVESLISKYPYWNRTLGADHFFVTCHDVGVRATEGLPLLVKNSIRAVCSPSYDVGFIPHKDVALPQVLQPFALPAGGNDVENRTTLGFWAGHRNSRIRVILARVWENDTELDIANNRINRATGHLVYQKKFYRTKFCICPGGSQVNSARIADSIHYGCIPVILSNYYDLPFNDILNWKKFAVVLKEKDVYQLKQILKGIPDEEFVALHNNLVKIQKHFQWNSPSVKFDAFHMFYLKASAGSPNGEEGKMMIRKEKDGWKIDFSGEKPPTPLLDTINYPVHMKNLSTEDLEQLAAELRADIVYTVAKVGGHLSASLGVVDLSVALHHVFNTPEDRIIWDVGHQAYPHKILTGRRSKMHTIRKTSGLAGFPKRDESIYDAFGAGHSSTSISAGLGMAVGRDLLGKNNNVICVIGDGAMTAGQAYEAMNNAGFLDSNLIVVLNDNNQVSLPTATLDGPATPVGALSGALSKLQSSTKFRKLREAAKSITKQIGSQAHEVAAKVDEYARGMLSAPGSTLFEELGLYYIGPVDGHNLEDLVTIFEKVKSMPVPGPVLIHIVTEKGKGYPPAEAAADKMHGVVKFDPETGKQSKPKSSTLSYTQYFAEALIKEAEVDNKIVAIHAAMGSGTGLNYFQKKFPDRCFDVGIAEQHAVTFAAGLATEGLKPFCAIYSSFLQRGYDQVVHDVDLQKLPVRFAMDRAGLVGADGPTHCGAFDIAYMACLPNMVVMAPSDEAELIHIVATAAAIDDRPSCFRFPRGNGVGAVLPFNNKGTPIEVGKGRIVMEGSRVAILGYGSIVQLCVEAAGLLKLHKISITVADARFCKPLDGELIRRLAREHEVLITAEEGSIGGFGSHVAHFLSLNGILDGPLKLRSMVLPDKYIDHGSPQDQIEEAGLSSRHICATVLSLLGKPKEALMFK